MDITLLDNMSNDLLKIFDDVHWNNKRHEGNVYDVDGSDIILNKTLAKDGFKLSRSGDYCKAKLSSIYDINNKTPINYYLLESLNERDILIKQLDFVKKGDTLIMDGGYYSVNLVNIFIDRGINFIFRMACSNLYSKNYKGNNNIFNKVSVGY